MSFCGTVETVPFRSLPHEYAGNLMTRLGYKLRESRSLLREMANDERDRQADKEHMNDQLSRKGLNRKRTLKS